MSWRLSMICIDPLTIEEGPFFWLIPCSSLFKDVRSNLGTRSSCKKQSPTDLPVWNSERIIPTRCKRCAHFAPCILLLHDPTKGSSTKQSEKETHCSENWTGFLRFQRFQMGHEGISTEYAYIILHLFLIHHHFWSTTNCWFICSQHFGSLSRWISEANTLLPQSVTQLCGRFNRNSFAWDLEELCCFIFQFWGIQHLPETTTKQKKNNSQLWKWIKLEVNPKLERNQPGKGAIFFYTTSARPAWTSPHSASHWNPPK